MGCPRWDGGGARARTGCDTQEKILQKQKKHEKRGGASVVQTVCTTAGVARGTARAGAPRTASTTHYIPCNIHAVQTTDICIRVEGLGRSEASPPVAPFQSPEVRERTPSPAGALLCPHCRTDCRLPPTSCQHGCKPQGGQRQQFAVFLCPPPPLSTLRTPRECPQVAALAPPLAPRCISVANANRRQVGPRGRPHGGTSAARRKASSARRPEGWRLRWAHAELLSVPHCRGGRFGRGPPVLSAGRAINPALATQRGPAEARLAGTRGSLWSRPARAPRPLPGAGQGECLLRCANHPL